MKRNLGIGLVPAIFLAVGGGLLFAAPARAVDCQKDFVNLMQARQNLIARVNDFNKKKPTAQLACSTLTQLVSADKKALDWVNVNKDWCQIPDNIAEGLKAQSEQSVGVRTRACSVAAQQAKEIAKQRQQREAGGASGPSGLPGSGVKLPQGAL